MKENTGSFLIEMDEGALIEELIQEEDMVLILFGTKTCGVCSAIKPRLIDMLNRYPKAKGIYVDIEKSQDIGAKYSIFTVPGVLLFIQGKESLREARYINIREIEGRVSKYYNLLY